MKGKIVILLLLMVTLVSLFAQTGEEPDYKLILLFRKSVDSPADENRLLLYETLLAKLSEISSDLIIIEPLRSFPEPAEEGTALDIKDISKWARREGADAWLEIQVRGEMSSLEIHYRLFDVSREVVAKKGILESKDATRGLERRFWDDITYVVSEVYRDIGSAGYEAEGERAAENFVLIKALPGTEITGLNGEASMIIPEKGWLRMKLLQPATYILTARLKGYYPVEESFFLGNDVVEIELEQRPGVRWGIAFHLIDAAYPGLEALYYLIPNYLFVRFGYSTFLIHSPIHEEHDFPLSFIDFSIGSYLSNPNRLLRFILTLGFFNRINHEGKDFKLDSLSSLGFSYSLGIDMPITKRIRLFMEHHPRLYVINNPDAIRAFWDSGTSDETDFLLRHDHYPMWNRVIFDPGRIHIGFQLQL
jgi:hypothetical protein